MTLIKLVEFLKISGKNTKLKVIKMLESTNIEELQELRESINERIRILSSKE